jgi:hypothetical protein
MAQVMSSPAALSRPTRSRLDRIAIALSALCVAHCVASAVLLALVSSFAAPLLHEGVHEIGLAIAVVLGGIALGRGIRAHGRRTPLAIGGVGLGLMTLGIMLPHDGSEIVATVIGVTLLAVGHWLNQRAVWRA